MISKMKGLELTKIIAKIEQFSPLSLAGSWDNVGMLVEPHKTAIISKIILTNDLTESVVNECIDKNANMILSYHPPIFKPLKRLTKAAWKVSNRLLNRYLNIFSVLHPPDWINVLGTYYRRELSYHALQTIWLCIHLTRRLMLSMEASTIGCWYLLVSLLRIYLWVSETIITKLIFGPTAITIQLLFMP